jgi:hypothetical protein
VIEAELSERRRDELQAMDDNESTRFNFGRQLHVVIFTRLTPGWSIDAITLQELQRERMSSGFESDEPFICLARYTAAPRPEQQDEDEVARGTTLAVVACYCTREQDALADLWGMALQFDSELSGADGSVWPYFKCSLMGPGATGEGNRGWYGSQCSAVFFS